MATLTVEQLNPLQEESSEHSETGDFDSINLEEIEPDTKACIEEKIITTLLLINNQEVILDEPRKILNVEYRLAQTRSADEGETLIRSHVYE